MTTRNRRDFLRTVGTAAGAGIGAALLPPAIQKALAIPANRRTGSIRDVEHIVVLTQENRSFDHYFGTLSGVRGFADRFPIPVPDAPGIERKNVWYQSTSADPASAEVVAPFHLNTLQRFDYMRVSGTPHSWPDAQPAWADGRMNQWPLYKNAHSMGYFARTDLPFQFAMAEAFTLCDAYHCSFQGGTNANRVFVWTGTNDPLQRGHGPVINNDYDNLAHDPSGGYSWVTYCERLQRAGISWQVYQNMADNFTDNPLAGFRQYRASYRGEAGAPAVLAARGLSTRDLDLLRDDVLEGKLPQVSWIVATAEGSEHPGPSSPAQGAEYTAQVLDALTADEEVWSKTVLLVNFDENDGFFDHVPPPAAPTYVSYHRDWRKAVLAGASTVDTTGEYHEFLAPDAGDEARALEHKPYGLGPRVPMYVLSPWSKGGWVNSQVFDHTSIIRFIEQRFGVFEPNISPWRRAVCGDLTSAFEFGELDDSAFFDDLPDTLPLAERARALANTTTPATPSLPELPAQELGARLSRALPYELHVSAEVKPATQRLVLHFENSGRAGAVFHVYDRNHLDRAPRRYTVEAQKYLHGEWLTAQDGGSYDLWVLGPNGFHRHFVGSTEIVHADRVALPETVVRYLRSTGGVSVELRNSGNAACTFTLTDNAYFRGRTWSLMVGPHASGHQHWSLRHCAHWYDFTATVEGLSGYARRFAGRVETGRDSFSDPATGGVACSDQQP